MIDRSRIPDPFEVDIVADPNEATTVDIPTIHQTAFKRCLETYDWVREKGRSWSVLLYGEAGCGKTHLLNRFRRWLDGQIKPEPKAAPAVFVAVRMRTAPSQVWAWTRRRLVEELSARRANGLTLLDGVLSSFASRAGALDAAFESARVSSDHNLVKVLKNFSSGQQRLLCRTWLAGGSLSEKDCGVLDLAPPKIAQDELFESDSESVVLSLVRLCAPSTVVFCFDQLEAMSLSRQDRAFAHFSRMGASLIDETSNSLVVSTILAKFLRDLQDDSPTDFRRIAKEQVDLQRLDWVAGKQLVEGRLALIPGLAQMKPIEEGDLRAFYRSQHERANPRDLIQKARELFREWQGREPETRDPEAFLREEFDALWEDSLARNSPTETGAILNHALPVLFQILDLKVQERPGKRIDLRVEGKGSMLAVCYGNQFAAYPGRRRSGKRQVRMAPLCRGQPNPVQLARQFAPHHRRPQEERFSGPF